MTFQEWVDTCGPIFVQAQAVARTITVQARAELLRGEFDVAMWLRRATYSILDKAKARVERITRGAFLAC